ncbi:TIGR03885 family FMN-dependent LLM class oxidoreductase (plasmid) [Paracoccus liaowanqingii]|uniref:TIGR03885 family FMN-dependent LLM class oxidoreductase n=1 Tax=Paracoccus liaowanqingii TaxID=2560053 RepID=A0A4Y5SVV2_9RHOB|nr:TIGR03885 family FMN-dependent LLM class oxidoreductase [Paracoccus liaowanqingii]QDA36926.1 TIGR03885 family FMN-dependent LLM class oxidoreductase [Paracoccus liaowanqingii]
MAYLGFHASHEQIDPRSLLDAVQLAETAGFAAAMCSDHFSPWSVRQGQSGFAWAWLGAALQSTSLPFGVVNAPGQRYHPAIVAQAAATLCQMYPDRFWMALGSGEAANEHITGDEWPEKSVRNARLKECVDIMRALFVGETVTHHGLVHVDRAKLWTRPQSSPRLVGPAISETTARWVGGWADGLITVNQPRDRLRRMVDAFRDGGGASKPVYLQVHLSYAGDDDTALRIAYDQWRSNVFDPPLCWDLELPEHFDEAARDVCPQDMHDTVLISSEPSRFIDWLSDFAELGFDGIYLHHVGTEQREFIETFGEHVLPAFNKFQSTEQVP